MATFDTQGWDAVGALTQKSLNVEIGALYQRGTLPKHIETTLSFGTFSGSLSIDIEQPTVNLGGVAQGIAELDCKVDSGILKVMGAPDTDLAGANFSISTAVNQVELTLSGQTIVKIFLDFKSRMMVVTAHVSGLSPLQQAVLNALLILAFQDLNEEYFLGTVDLSDRAIPDYLLPRSVAFTLVPHPVDANLNEILFLLTTLGTPGRKNYSDTVIPDGQEGAVLISNERLLTNIIGKALQDAVPNGTFAYSLNSYALVAPTTLDDYDLNGAVATVEGNAIHVKLNAAAMHQFGGGINVYFESDSSVTISYDPVSSSFQVSQVTPPPNTSWTAEWWVWLLGGATFIGLIVAPILGAIAAAAAVDISKAAIDQAFQGALKPIQWPVSDYVTPTEVNFPGPLQMFVVPHV